MQIEDAFSLVRSLTTRTLSHSHTHTSHHHLAVFIVPFASGGTPFSSLLLDDSYLTMLRVGAVRCASAPRALRVVSSPSAVPDNAGRRQRRRLAAVHLCAAAQRASADHCRLSRARLPGRLARALVARLEFVADRPPRRLLQQRNAQRRQRRQLCRRAQRHRVVGASSVRGCKVS